MSQAGDARGHGAKRPQGTGNDCYGGFYSDRLAEKSGCPPEPRIVPFREEYLKLPTQWKHLAGMSLIICPISRMICGIFSDNGRRTLEKRSNGHGIVLESTA